MSFVILLGARTANAGDADEVKALVQKATGEFGVGHYEQAAAHFEAAFQLRPEAALLYNAAQGYRLAGKMQRALELYRNVVLLYATSPQAVDAKHHIENLSQQLQQSGAGRTAPAASATAPPATTAPPPAMTTAPPAASPPPPRAPDPAPQLALAAPPPAPAVAVVSAPSPSPPAATAKHRSILASPWLWVGAGVVLLGATAAMVLAAHPSYPTPSLGSGNAN